MLRVNNISVAYTSDKTVLQGINFTLKKGEILAILGASGEGKTTLLKSIQGLLTLTKGKIYFKGKTIPNPEEVLVPGVEGINTVFQDFNLTIGLSVFHNIKHQLKHLPLDKQYEFTQEIIQLCKMESFADKFPKELSGGQKQKTALAMAVVSEPDIVLLDEPFSNLDALSKQEIVEVLLDLNAHLGIAFIFVTHNPIEAFEIANDILLLQEGKQSIYSSIEEILTTPLSVAQAKLLGFNNIVSGKSLCNYVNQCTKEGFYHIPSIAIQCIISKTKNALVVQRIPHPNIPKYLLTDSKNKLQLIYYGKLPKSNHFTLKINSKKIIPLTLD